MKKQKFSAFSLMELSIVILIIGIVVTGLASSSGLIKKYRLSNARSITKASDVHSIEDLVFWLDATGENKLVNSSNSAVISNNDTIKTWLDQNPKNTPPVTFSEYTSGAGPTYLIDGINGLPTLSFNAASDGSAYDGMVSPFSSTLNPREFTIFVVTQAMDPTSTWGTVLMSRGGSFEGFNLYKKDSALNWEFWFGNSSAWSNAADTSFNANTPYIITLRYTANNTTAGIFRNGILKGSNSSSTFKPYGGSGAAGFGIGYPEGTASYWGYDGYISEIIMFGRSLNNEERGSVEAYLAKKYKIKVG